MKKRILFVDDEPNLLQGLHRMLRPMSEVWDMSFAGNGLEAMKYMAHTPCDVVATDIVMPELGGVALAEQLYRQTPGLPVVFMTGYADDELDRTGQWARRAPLINKPFVGDELVRTVQRALRAAPPAER